MAYSFDSLQSEFFWYDDFLGDQLKDEWVESGSAGGDADVVDGVEGGIVRITTDGDNGDSWQISWGTTHRILHILNRIAVEYRLRIEDSTVSFMQTSLQFDVNNRILFYETGDAWRIRTTDGGAQTDAASGVVVDANFHILRIQAHLHGSSHVHFYVDGVETDNSPSTTNIPDDAADFFEPQFYVSTSENVAHYIDLDYVAARQDI